MQTFIQPANNFVMRGFRMTERSGATSNQADPYKESNVRSTTRRRATMVTDPPLARFLFGDLRLAWVWLPLRLWLGWDWLNHGWEKFQNPAWIDTGAALKGFWGTRPCGRAQGSHHI